MRSKGSQKTQRAPGPTKRPKLQSDPQDSESKIERNSGNLSLAKAQRLREGLANRGFDSAALGSRYRDRALAEDSGVGSAGLPKCGAPPVVRKNSGRAQM